MYALELKKVIHTALEKKLVVGLNYKALKYIQMSVQVIINAGHHITDKGCVSAGYQENLLTMAIRDRVKELLPDAFYVPDNLNLKDSIKWVLTLNPEKDAICVDIHLNYHPYASQRGIEAYYWQDPTIAECFSRNVAEAVGLSNRGYRKDTETAVGSLGWIRQLPTRSVLVECGFLSNYFDRQIIISAEGQKEIAQGIYNACLELGYRKKTESVNNWKTIIDLLKKAGMSFDDIIGWIKKFFGNLQPKVV